MSKKYILVTGANSFVAKNLIDKQFIRNYNCIETDIVSRENKIDFIKADLVNILPSDIPYKKIDHILHLGAVSTSQSFQNDVKTSYQTNLLSLLNVIEIAKEKKTKSIIFASSEWVYGQNNNNFQIEADKIDTKDLGSEYALSKLLGEQILRYYCNKNKIKLLVLRFGIIYGNKDINLCAVEAIFKSLMKDSSSISVGSLSSARRFIHVDDICRAINLALQYNENITLNISGDSLISMKTIIETSSKLLSIDPDITETNPNDISVRNPDNTLAKKTLKWEPLVSLQEGLTDYWRYVKKN